MKNKNEKRILAVLLSMILMSGTGISAIAEGMPEVESWETQEQQTEIPEEEEPAVQETDQGIDLYQDFTDEEGNVITTIHAWVPGDAFQAVLILAALPLTLPKLLGYRIYGITTGSMEPELPKGSIVYVKTAEVEDIRPGDRITFVMGTDTEKVTTHRVVEIDEENQQFITKGDANASEDAQPVKFSRLVGKVVLGVPVLGTVSLYLHSAAGMAVCAGIFALALALWKIVAKMKLKESSK